VDQAAIQRLGIINGLGPEDSHWSVLKSRRKDLSTEKKERKTSPPWTNNIRFMKKNGIWVTQPDP